jgi:Ca-activated chloride channel family protein
MFLIMITSGLRVTAQPKPAAAPDLQSSSGHESQEVKSSAGERPERKSHPVTLTVSVADATGHYISGLGQRDFMLTDNQISQQIAFVSNEDLPASIAIVFDVSSSMSRRRMARADEALANFVNRGREDDEYFLITFNARPQLLLDGSRDADALVRTLSSLKPDGNTALYDALYLALDRIARGTYKKHVVLIISDGKDNDSRHTYDGLRHLLMESDVTVYAIDTNAMPLPKDFYGSLVLDELAKKSGGRMFTPKNTAEMNDAFNQIAVELRHQVSIGFRPADSSRDGKWHRLKVTVAPPPSLKRVVVRTREGYYAVRSPN